MCVSESVCVCVCVCLSVCVCVYLVLVCALGQLLELGVQQAELACDAFDAGVQTSVLRVLTVEVILIELPLLWRYHHSVLPVHTGRRHRGKHQTKAQKCDIPIYRRADIVVNCSLFF